VPAWSYGPYAGALSHEQQTEFLRQQIEWLKQQLDTIGQRIEELGKEE
jgi:prefoldin subunit 5